MSFMQAQVTEKVLWVEIEGEPGISFVPFDYWEGGWKGRKPLNIERLFIENGNYEPGKYEARLIKGYGVRASASGYLDCTEWDVYTDKRKAQKAYNELRRELREED